MLHRQQVVTGGDAGTAVQHHFLRRTIAEQGVELLAQLDGGLEASVAEIERVMAVARARNMAGRLVQRFDFAAVTFRRARIDQQEGAIGDGAIDLVDARRFAIAIARLVVPRRDLRNRSLDRQAERRPARETTIEHGDGLVPEALHQPPETRGCHRAVAGVVGHDLRLRRDAQPLEHRAEIAVVRHRMAPGDRRLAMVGEVAIEVRIAGAGQMRFAPGLFAGFRIGAGQYETAIDDGQVGLAERGSELQRGHQGRPAHVVASSLCRKFTSIAAVAPQIR